MDEVHFDDLSRALGLSSRRGALAVLATAILGALVGSDPSRAAAGSKRQHSRQHRRDAHERLLAEKHKKRRKKKRRRQGGGATTPPPPPGSLPSPPPPGPAACVGQCASSMPCGADGCGGSCGSCAAKETCRAGRCQCTPVDCSGRQCGPDGCGGTCGSGCAPQETCDNGTCVCIGQCAGRECGDDGCGLPCGGCAEPSGNEVTCTPDGFCAVTPKPGFCSGPVDCAMNNPCMIDSCESGTCRQEPVTEGTRCTQSSGSPGLCDTRGHCMECLGDGDCNADIDCTANSCQNGVCQHPPLGAGAPCTRSGGGSGVCDGAGQCVRCVSDAQCDDGNSCHIPRCEPNSHTCAYAYKENYTPCGGTNTCLNGECLACRPSGVPCDSAAQCCDAYDTNAPAPGLCWIGRCCKNGGSPCQTGSECCLFKCGDKPSSSGYGTCQ